MSTNQQEGSRPTVVLVHGAFADGGASWNEVIKRLQAEGIQVTAPANPLRGISIDSAYIGSLLERLCTKIPSNLPILVQFGFLYQNYRVAGRRLTRDELTGKMDCEKSEGASWAV